MNLAIISIANSKGIRLPKVILDKYGIHDSIEIILEEDCIILKPNTNVRLGWEKSFKAAQKENDIELLINDVFED